MLAATIVKELAPSGKNAAISKLLKSGGYRAPSSSPPAEPRDRLVLPAKGREPDEEVRQGPKPVLVAAGKATVSARRSDRQDRPHAGGPQAAEESRQDQADGQVHVHADRQDDADRELPDLHAQALAHALAGPGAKGPGKSIRPELSVIGETARAKNNAICGFFAGGPRSDIQQGRHARGGEPSGLVLLEIRFGKLRSSGLPTKTVHWRN